MILSGTFFRYLTGYFLKYFLSAVIVFVALFLVADYLGDLGRFEGAGQSLIVQYYFYLLPETIYRMVPVATLVGTIFTLTQLQRTHELVGALSLGISLRQMSFYIFLWSVGTGLFVAYLGDQWLPSYSLKKNVLYHHHIRKNPGSYLIEKTGKIWYKTGDNFFFLSALDPSTNKASQFIMFSIDLEKWDIYQVTQAKHVEISGNTWILNDGSVTLLSANQGFPITQKFDSKNILVAEEARDLINIVKPSDLLSFGELIDFIKKNKQAGLDTTRYEVDLYSKVAFAFAGTVMSFLAIPIVIKRGRSGGNMGAIAVALGLTFLYWIFYSSGVSLGYYGKLPPMIAAMGPTFIMLLLSFYGISQKKM
ncbi:MAG: LptF/LptG family permease [Bdellovibrionaceae bacterium]|nr:LptF/LptG family permease [Pseudobdellovibrionaceae bacterium]MDW8190380.1 LptF/LptG family permease [Pseudobdellovibrionaceae bacterium]